MYMHFRKCKAHPPDERCARSSSQGDITPRREELAFYFTLVTNHGKLRFSRSLKAAVRSATRAGRAEWFTRGSGAGVYDCILRSTLVQDV